MLTVPVDLVVTARAKQLNQEGLAPLDAAHVACAEVGECDRFLTCDDRLLKTARNLKLKVAVQNPVDYVKEGRYA